MRSSSQVSHSGRLALPLLLLGAILVAGCGISILPRVPQDRRLLTRSASPTASARASVAQSPPASASPSLSASPSAGPSPTERPSRTAPLTRLPALSHLVFATAEIGWAGGVGFMLGTEDGGRTWASQWTGSGAVIGLTTVDRDHAWALVSTGPDLGTADVLLTTTDGRTWTPHAIELPLSELSMTGPNAGWAIVSPSGTTSAADYLASTADGGQTWRASRLLSAVDAVCVSGANLVWVTGRNGIFRSRDRGRSWPEVSAGSSPGSPAAYRTYVRCKGEAAWVLSTGGATAGQQAYRVDRTLDGGAHWSAVLEQPTPVGQPFFARIDADAGPFGLFSATQAGFIGSCPSCGTAQGWSFTRTNDGGATFTHAQFTGVAAHDTLSDVSFVDAIHGWISGFNAKGGFLLLTTDGGQTWRRRS
jgi:photosystem II stability/assembly factor-like uncharacterized protein